MNWGCPNGCKSSQTAWTPKLKPVFDFFVAIVAVLILLPFIFILTIILSIANGGKPFFLQERGGKNEQIFKVIKFKTMSDKKDAFGNLLPDAERAVGGLVLDRRVPPAVEVKHMVGARQVQTRTACFERQNKDRR
mgnify:CR=1 FL=1